MSEEVQKAMARAKIDDASSGPMSLAKQDRRVLAAEIKRLRAVVEDLVCRKATTETIITQQLKRLSQQLAGNLRDAIQTYEAAEAGGQGDGVNG